MCKILWILVGLMLVIFTFPSGGFTYEPPIGIPEPDFGVDETVESLYGSSSFYTHWIDNTHPDASNSNGDGTVDKPLMDPFKGTNSITLDSGSVMVINGGPYSYPGMKVFKCNGTAGNPVIIRGADPVNRILFQATDGYAPFKISGSYFIIENIEFAGGIRLTLTSNPDHVCIRNCEIQAEGLTVPDIGSVIGGKGQYVVIYQCHIHHMWKGDGLDCHGVNPGRGSKYWWVLENEINNNSGDAFQATHGASSGPPQYLYIGRNIMHNDRENGVDLKYSTDIIVSENVCYGYTSCGEGGGIVVGSDGAPTRAWLLFNTIYNSCRGITVEATDETWIIGNRIYHIDDSAITLEKYCQALHIIGNTIYDVDKTINQYALDEFCLHIFNNVFVNIRQKYTHLNIESKKVADCSEMSNNLFWRGGNTIYIRWASGNKKGYNSTSDFNDFTGGTNNIIANPLFEDAANADFDLQQTSPAIDAGLACAAFDTFYAWYGIDIKYDYTGKVRPQRTGWDIGAYEYPDSIDTQIVDTEPVKPDHFLLRIYPNPFNPNTHIHFSLPVSDRVELSIYDITGRRIVRLIDGYRTAGEYTLEWNASDTHGNRLAGGVYLLQIQAGSYHKTVKMLYAK
jgi:hypothetical protein